jgi:hypothetical protein
MMNKEGKGPIGLVEDELEEYVVEEPYMGVHRLPEEFLDGIRRLPLLIRARRI